MRSHRILISCWVAWLLVILQVPSVHAQKAPSGILWIGDPPTEFSIPDSWNPQDTNLFATRVLSWLHNQGYLLAEQHPLPKDAKASVAINAGPLFTWTYLKPGNTSPVALRNAGFREHRYRDHPLHYQEVVKLRERIVQWYEGNGYPFASVRLDSLEVTGQTVHASLYTDPGQVCRWDSLIIKSNDRISPRLLQNQIGFGKNDLYSESMFAQVDKKLKALPYLNITRQAEVVFIDGKARLYVYPQEKQASRFDGIVGLLQDDKTGKVYLTGDIKLQLQNTLHHGESLKLSWQQVRAGTQRLRTEASYPFLFQTPFGIQGALDLYKKDSTFLDVKQRLGFAYAINSTSRLHGFIERKNTSTLQNKGSTATQFANIHSLLNGLGFVSTNVPMQTAPLHGYFIEAEAGLGNRRATIPSGAETSAYPDIKGSSLQAEFRLIAGVYVPVAKRHVLYGALQSGSKTGSEALFRNELLRIGGFRSLRGFDEESVWVSTYVILTGEYRLMLEENSYLYVFLDRSFYEARMTDRYLKDDPYGFGAGMSFDTKAGIFTIGYALGKQLQNPILFRNGRIHFGLVNIF
ncbi:MAG: hypothetical protein H6585_02385 [Flavobacteriales bacterium]|nr:hypothetical protein [Flavobacteriales bacterium]MCB9447176.1 hypothetical protein [Flavobacteriales bacterium]